MDLLPGGWAPPAPPAPRCQATWQTSHRVPRLRGGDSWQYVHLASLFPIIMYSALVIYFTL